MYISFTKRGIYSCHLPLASPSTSLCQLFPNPLPPSISRPPAHRAHPLPFPPLKFRSTSLHSALLPNPRCSPSVSQVTPLREHFPLVFEHLGRYPYFRLACHGGDTMEGDFSLSTEWQGTLVICRYVCRKPANLAEFVAIFQLHRLCKSAICLELDASVRPLPPALDSVLVFARPGLVSGSCEVQRSSFPTSGSISIIVDHFPHFPTRFRRTTSAAALSLVLCSLPILSRLVSLFFSRLLKKIVEKMVWISLIIFKAAGKNGRKKMVCLSLFFHFIGF